jgi:Sec-independent protein translocase protein TatA
VLGPERLPDAVRRFMHTYNELKKMGSGFQSEIRSAFEEPMQEMRKTADMVRDAADPTKLAAEAEAEQRLRDDAATTTGAAATPVVELSTNGHGEADGVAGVSDGDGDDAVAATQDDAAAETEAPARPPQSSTPPPPPPPFSASTPVEPSTSTSTSASSVGSESNGRTPAPPPPPIVAPVTIIDPPPLPRRRPEDG